MIFLRKKFTLLAEETHGKTFIGDTSFLIIASYDIEGSHQFFMVCVNIGYRILLDFFRADMPLTILEIWR
ncbi:MAG TPA: hypothetical protein VM884_10195 [Flavisolibacter sp.]|nr:hypothetical protein [Flavisolibacter sp.]